MQVDCIAYIKRSQLALLEYVMKGCSREVRQLVVAHTCWCAGAHSHMCSDIAQDIAIMARRRAAAVHCCFALRAVAYFGCAASHAFTEGACRAQAQRQSEHGAGEAEPLRSR